MRIAFVTSEYITEQNFDGGLANYLYRIVVSLKERGHQPVVFVASREDGSFEHAGAHVIRVRVNLKPLWFVYRSPWHKFSQPCKWLCESWSLRQALRREHIKKSFDIVQYASYRAPGFFRQQDIPTIVRISSLQSLWRQFNKQQSDAVSRFENFLELSAFRKADSLYGPSHVIASKVQSLVGKNVSVIESPVVSIGLQVGQSPIPGSLQAKRYLLFFGSINVLKGMLTIAETLVPLLSRYPDLIFVFAGKIDNFQGDAFDDYLRNAAGRHQEQLLFLGRLPHQELMPVVRNATGVVLPSRIDNLPNTCIEAMACGKVVIGTRGASFEQLIVDGENGFLVDIDSSGQLLSAMEKLLNMDEKSRATMGSRAAATIQRLTPELICEQLEEFYRNCLRSCQ
ncbi:MAG: glycosyltransferase family 4 protein [Desulfuromonadales bacterium]|nr:glycosyltransferase family 4 protein [Desulfuromonadales bacterium]